MAKRRFRLPGIQDLSKEQEDVRALPLDGQHLIVGGPGTGKSVMALLRARALSMESKDYLFLVFNHLLNTSSLQLFGSDLESKQWQSWFFSIFREKFKKALPMLPAQPGSSFRKFDWQRIQQYLDDLDPSVRLPLALVIDEGQDMPPEFYEDIDQLGYDNIFVVADQNQQIIDGENSSRQDIENALGIATESVIELRTNFRNNLPIARLAREFYVFDPASPPPDLPPPPRHEVRKPILFAYRPEQFESVIQRILRMADIDPSRLIGILCPNNKVRRKYYEAMLRDASQFDNGRPKVMTYSSHERNAISFDEGGVLVINAQACKGLEFDVVFIADIDKFPFNHQDKNKVKRLFYVMVARAIDIVIMLRNAKEPLAVEGIIPRNPDILEIK